MLYTRLFQCLAIVSFVLLCSTSVQAGSCKYSPDWKDLYRANGQAVKSLGPAIALTQSKTNPKLFQSFQGGKLSHIVTTTPTWTFTNSPGFLGETVFKINFQGFTNGVHVLSDAKGTCTWQSPNPAAIVGVTAYKAQF